MTCDNQQCGKTVTLDYYGSIEPDSEPEWFRIYRAEKKTIELIENDEIYDEKETVINEEFESDFCSLKCVVEGAKAML